jgi:hypothetical protein
MSHVFATFALVLVACGGAATPVVTPAPAATTFELADITAYNGAQRWIALQLDGKSGVADVLRDAHATLRPGPTLAPDGSLSFDRHVEIEVHADGAVIDVAGSAPVAMRVTSDGITFSDPHRRGVALGPDGHLRWVKPAPSPDQDTATRGGATDDPPPPPEEDDDRSAKDSDRAEGQYKMKNEDVDPQLARRQAIEQARNAGILGVPPGDDEMGRVEGADTPGKRRAILTLIGLALLGSDRDYLVQRMRH